MRPTAQALFGEAGTPTVAVIGAGFGGIATGVKLRRAGIETFTIYEASAGVGGTWWDNTYPGAEVDVGSNLYCFSFKPHTWTRTHARQPELQRYLEETVDEHGLRAHLRLDTAVESATWDDDRHVWTLRLGGGKSTECHVLISAVGFLNVPRYPGWPGMEQFGGAMFHTARWEHEHELAGKTIAVVGTGSSATQVVPAIQPVVRQLFVFQREPGWIMPKGEHDLSPEERAALTRPFTRLRERWRMKWLLEKSLWRGHLYRPGTKVNEARHAFCLSYIERHFQEHPTLRDAVTPRYPYPGKRPIFASTFYPALKKPNVELVPRAVAAVTPTGLIDVDGVERAVDVIVLATGFRAADYLSRVTVAGRGGQSLHERWAGEPRAYLGITVPDFPNFFMLYGPGTNGGEIVTMLESQAEYTVHAVKRMIRERVTSVEVKPWFEERWNRWLQQRMRGTSWTMSSNYFTAPTGNVVTQWPYGNLQYRALTKLLGRVSEQTRRRDIREPTELS